MSSAARGSAQSARCSRSSVRCSGNNARCSRHNKLSQHQLRMHAQVPRPLAATLALLIATVAASVASTADAAPKPPARIAFDESLTSPSTIVPTLEALPKASRFPVIARVEADRQTLEPDAKGVYHFESLDARLSQYRDKQIPVWLTITGLTASDVAAGQGPHDAWGRFARALARRLAGRAAIVELTVPDVSGLSDAVVDLVAFDIKRAAIELHGADANIIVAVGVQRFADASRLDAFYARDLAAYLDAVVVGADGAGAGVGAGAMLDVAGAR